ncbi:MAG: hypothetical protein WA610_10030 [Thermodesulfovibrionales bacterium]
MKISTRLIIAVLTLGLLAACGPTTFIISKDNRAYYLGRKSENLHTMLCKSGDLELILSETIMPDDLKKELYRFNCTEERSKEKVLSLYLFLTPEEKEDFKSVFRRHGYTINYVPC